MAPPKKSMADQERFLNPPQVLPTDFNIPTSDVEDADNNADAAQPGTNL